MKRLQAFRYELKPNGEQERKMRQFAGAARFVFNRALALQNEERKSFGRKQSGYGALSWRLTAWRNDPGTAWLQETPVHTTQQAIRNLEAGWSRHFDSLQKLRRGEIKPEEVIEPPKFKKKHKCREAFRYPDPAQFRVEQCNNRLFLPKLGWIGYRNSRRIEGQIANITVFEQGSKWYVSIQTEREVEPPLHPSNSIVGIDLGVVRFATLSSGEVIPPLNSLKQKLALLRRYQRMMARRVKGSRNWQKAKARVNCMHRKIANMRTDFLHKTTTAISKNHAIAVIEDLNVQKMSSSAAGTKENPGRKVRQKSGLNRAILDQGWGEFRRQLEYKQQSRGGKSSARCGPAYQPAVPALPTHFGVQPSDAGALLLCQLRLHGQRGRCCFNKHSFSAEESFCPDEGQDRAHASSRVENYRAGIACVRVNGAGMLLSSRNPLEGRRHLRRPAGISGLQAGEDVKLENPQS
jgi:putative transposase